jgi:protein disulfide-isomerase-like protein
MAFINKHAEPTGGPAPAITSDSAAAAGITSTPVAPSTPKIDFNPRGEVEVLTDKTFSAALARGPAFVKFYAPWCGHCKKLAPHWAQLAAHEKNKLTIAEVNCEEEGGLCKREGVNGYPALFYYFASGQKTEYTGGRKFEALSTFADKAASPYVISLLFPEAMTDRIYSAVQELPEGKLDEKLKEDEVVFVFLQPVAEPKILVRIQPFPLW